VKLEKSDDDGDGQGFMGIGVLSNSASNARWTAKSEKFEYVAGRDLRDACALNSTHLLLLTSLLSKTKEANEVSTGLQVYPGMQTVKVSSDVMG